MKAKLSFDWHGNFTFLTVDSREMTNQLLDDMDLERERGITIKSHAIQMSHEKHKIPT